MGDAQSLGLGALHLYADRAQRIEHVIVKRPLDGVLAFTGFSIDDVINNPIARNIVYGYYKLDRHVRRRCETIDLERQWNPTGAMKG